MIDTFPIVKNRVSALSPKTSLMFLVILLFALVAGTSFAADVTFQVKADKNVVSLGESLTLGLTFYGTQSIDAPDIPEIDGFKSSYIGPSTMVSIVNGEVSSSITHNYVLLPLKVGIYKIGPFSVDYRGRSYTSQPIEVQVVKSAPSQAPLNRAPVYGQNDDAALSADDLREKIFVQIDVGKRDLYLNEETDVSVKLFVNSLGVRDIEYPVLAADGFSKAEFGKPIQYKKTVGGISYDVIEFKTRIFPVKTGVLALGPAKVKCNLIMRDNKKRRSGSFFDDFFGDDFFTTYSAYPLELESFDIPINVSDFPEEGRPDDFSGAVGHFTIDVKADPKDVNVGDPVTVKMVIRGEGNWTSVRPPKINTGEDFKVYDPQEKETAGGKAFEEVVIPKTEKVDHIPEISFSYFDTATGKYATARSGPIPITVKPAPKGERVEIVEAPASGGEARTVKERFGRDIVYIKDSLGAVKRGEDLYKNKLFILAQLFPILLILASALYAGRKRRYESDVRYARLKRAPKAAGRGLAKARRLMREDKKEEFYAVLYETMRSYVGDKFHIPSGGITVDTIDERLRREGLGEAALVRLKSVFSECDMVRFGRTGGDMVHLLEEAESVIAKLERFK